MNNSTLKERAKLALKGDYGLAIAVMLLGGIVSSAASGFTIIGVAFISYPIVVGMTRFHYMVTKNKAELEQLFWGFSNEYFKQITSILFMRLLLALWTLLLIIPGIVKSLSYALVPYLLMDEDFEVYDFDAITKSREMMDGHKARLFWLQLSFIGWVLLCILTLGIGFIFLMPYYQQTMLQFYLDVKLDVIDLKEVHQVVDEIMPKLEEINDEEANEWDF